MKEPRNALVIVLFFSMPLWLADRKVQPDGSQKSKSQAVLQQEAGVTLKLVQVVVMDKKGNPVTDLRKDEFVLYDNKEEKKLTEFESNSLSIPAAPPPALEPAEKPPFSTAPLLNRKFLFLFDFVFSDPKGFRIARESAIRFIDSDLRPEDEAGVISFAGGRNVQVHEFLTKDHLSVRRTIESLSIGNLLQVSLINTRDEPEMQVYTGEGGAKIAVGRPSPSGARIVVGNFIWALSSLAQALRYVPGKKHVVFYSSGINGGLLGRGGPAGTNADIGYSYTKLGKELAAANASVYPVNTEDPNPFKSWNESRTGAPALREIASVTGGRYLGFAVNAPEHMEKVNTLTGTYYVLGYPIDETWDGKYHKIEVKVTRPGCEVHAQPGYFNPKPFPEYSDLEKEIQLVDLALASKPLSQVPVRFAMQALPCALTQPNNLAIVAEVPFDRLEGVAGKNVEVSGLVFNGFDQIVDRWRSEVDFTAGVFKRNKAYVFSFLSVPPGTNRCRVVLRNTETGKAAVASATCVVPERNLKKAMLLPPLLLAPQSDAIYFGGSSAKGLGKDNRTKPRDAQNQVAKAYLFEPEKFAPYLGETLQRTSEIFAAVRFAAAKEDASGLELSADLSESTTGKRIPVPLTVVSMRAEKEVSAFFVRLQILIADAGAYKLALYAHSPSGSVVSRVARTYIIR